MAGFGDAAPVVLAARAVAGRAIDRAAAATDGFRFATIDDYRHPLFMPGAVRYLDLPGLVALNAPHPLWLAGEDRDAVLIEGGYPACEPERLVLAGKADDNVRVAAAEWLVDPGLVETAR